MICSRDSSRMRAAHGSEAAFSRAWTVWSLREFGSKASTAAEIRHGYSRCWSERGRARSWTSYTRVRSATFGSRRITMETTGSTALSPGNSPPTQISTHGEFNSPRGCRGTVWERRDRRGDAHRSGLHGDRLTVSDVRGPGRADEGVTTTPALQRGLVRQSEES